MVVRSQEISFAVKKYYQVVANNLGVVYLHTAQMNDDTQVMTLLRCHYYLDGSM